jgi:hypothetical protein
MAFDVKQAADDVVAAVKAYVDPAFAEIHKKLDAIERQLDNIQALRSAKSRLSEDR